MSDPLTRIAQGVFVAATIFVIASYSDLGDAQVHQRETEGGAPWEFESFAELCHTLSRSRSRQTTVALVDAVQTTSGITPASTASMRLSFPTTVFLPADPFQRCAVKALRGDYGPIPDWKRDTYLWGLAHNVTVPAGNRAKITSYGPWEPCGTHTFSGERATTQFVSVDRAHVPLGVLLWTPWGLRYAMDTGGAVKIEDRYLLDSENQNLDYYTEHGIETARNQPWVIVKTHTDWNWYGKRKWRDWSRQGPWKG